MAPELVGDPQRVAGRDGEAEVGVLLGGPVRCVVVRVVVIRGRGCRVRMGGVSGHLRQWAGIRAWLACQRRPAAHAADRQAAADQAQPVAADVHDRPRRCPRGRAAPGPGSAHRAGAVPSSSVRSSPATCPGQTECPMPNGLPTTNTRLPSFGPSAAARIGRRTRGDTSSNVKPVCGSAASQRAAWGAPGSRARRSAPGPGSPGPPPNSHAPGAGRSGPTGSRRDD